MSKLVPTVLTCAPSNPPRVLCIWHIRTVLSFSLRSHHHLLYLNLKRTIRTPIIRSSRRIVRFFRQLFRRVVWSQACRICVPQWIIQHVGIRTRRRELREEQIDGIPPPERPGVVARPGVVQPRRFVLDVPGVVFLRGRGQFGGSTPALLARPTAALRGV